MANFSTELHADLLPHHLNTFRFAGNLQAGVAARLMMMRDELEDLVLKGDVGGAVVVAARERRAEKLVADMRDLTARTYRQIGREQTEQLAQFVGIDQRSVGAIINRNAGLDLVRPTASLEQARRLARDTLINGSPARDWWAKQRNDTTHRFASEVRAGMVAGETNQQIIRRISGRATGRRVRRTVDGKQLAFQMKSGGAMDVAQHQAAALVQTSTAAVANAARNDLYQANADVIRGKQAVATLDNLTSPICRARDGMAWDLDGEPVPDTGTTERFPGPPPWHFNCRTTLIPLLKTPDALAKRVRDRLPEATRASMDGQVSEKITYETWLRDQPVSRQQDVLGKRRWDLWRGGRITMRDMVDQSGRPLTVQQLEERFDLLDADDGTIALAPAAELGVDLPEGWEVEDKVRSTSGIKYKVYISPTGKKYYSLKQAQEAAAVLPPGVRPPPPPPVTPPPPDPKPSGEIISGSKLPDGWRKIKKTGSAGRTYTVYVSPTGRQYWSRKQALIAAGAKDLTPARTQPAAAERPVPRSETMPPGRERTIQRMRELAESPEYIEFARRRDEYNSVEKELDRIDRSIRRGRSSVVDRANYTDLSNRARLLKGQVLAAAEKAQRLGHRELANLKPPANKASITPIQLFDTNPTVEKGIERGHKFLTESGYNYDLGRMHYELADRGSFSAFNSAIRVRNSTTDDVTKTVVHELGHAAEGTSVIIRSAGQRFVSQRIARANTKDVDLGRFSSSSRGEKGNKDSFDTAVNAVRVTADKKRRDLESYYAGKKYVEFTEVHSMGFEMLYENPIAFQQADPEWFDFTIRTLYGDH